MSARRAALLAAVALACAAAVLASLWSDIALAADGASENTVRFQDPAGNMVTSYTSGQTALFVVASESLSTFGTSTGQWTGTTATVPAGTWWNLATGQPQPSAYSISLPTRYDTTIPSNTPLTLPDGPWTARVDGVATLITAFNSNTGEFALLTNVSEGSTVVVEFRFHLIDTYGPSDRRVRVYGTSDPDGEWAQIAEVAAVGDPTPSPTSALFRGEVDLSSDSSALATGDGMVWVQADDSLTVAFYQADGAMVVASASASIVASVSTPVPVASLAATITMAVTLAAALLWKLSAGTPAGTPAG